MQDTCTSPIGAIFEVAHIENNFNILSYLARQYIITLKYVQVFISPNKLMRIHFLLYKELLIISSFYFGTSGDWQCEFAYYLNIWFHPEHLDLMFNIKI